jgi:CO/xanthine dehydrogenase Mo-binding subunit
MAYINNLIARARQQMKLEGDEKKRRATEAAARAKAEAEQIAKEEEERMKAEAEAKRKGVSIAEIKKPQGVTEENRLAAQQHYMEGIKYFQNSNYDKARDEWTIARQLDPGNADAAAGLKRIESILSGGQ